MKMLICHDGSEQADKAMRLAATLAAVRAAEVTLFGIVEAAGQSHVILDALKRGQALMQDKHVPAELISKSGHPVSEIIRQTQAAAYDLVVIGAVRKGTQGLFWMSSKAYKIIKEIQPPVLIVSGNTARIRRMLVCSGGRQMSQSAVQLIGELARCAEASVTLFHVMPELPGIYATMPGMDETVARLLKSRSELGLNLRREQETLESLGVPTAVRLGHGGVLDSILHELHEGGYDLVVSGSALSRGLRTYILGDITREIVNRARCSVLVARTEQPYEHGVFGLRALLGGTRRRSG